MNPNQIDKKVDTVRLNQHQQLSNAFEWEPAKVVNEVSPPWLMYIFRGHTRYLFWDIEVITYAYFRVRNSLPFPKTIRSTDPKRLEVLTVLTLRVYVSIFGRYTVVWKSTVFLHICTRKLFKPCLLLICGPGHWQIII